MYFRNLKRPRRVRAGVFPHSPPAPDRGRTAFIPGLGLGYGPGSPQNQDIRPRRFGK